MWEIAAGIFLGGLALGCAAFVLLILIGLLAKAAADAHDD